MALELEEEEAPESEDYDASGPEGVLRSAGFDGEQAAALVEAMRMCAEESSAPAPKSPSKGGKGGGVDLALVFGGPKKKGGK